MNFVTEESEELREIGDVFRKRSYLAPFRSHARWRMQGNLAPFGGTIDQQQNIANVRGLSTAPLMRDFSTNCATSSRPEKSSVRRRGEIRAPLPSRLVAPRSTRGRLTAQESLISPALRARMRIRSAVREERRTRVHARSDGPAVQTSNFMLQDWRGEPSR